MEKGWLAQGLTLDLGSGASLLLSLASPLPGDSLKAVQTPTSALPMFFFAPSATFWSGTSPTESMVCVPSQLFKYISLTNVGMGTGKSAC